MLPAVINQPQSGGPPVRRARVSLKFSLVAISLLTVALTAASVHMPWLLVSRDNVAEMARQLNTEIVTGVNREVGAIFESAVAAQQALRDALRDGVFDIEDKRARDRLFFAFLNANPHFSWVSFGKPNGDFYGVQRRDEVNLRIVESRWNPERVEAERTEDYYVDDGEQITHTTTRFKVNDYFAPARAWYRLATRNHGQHIWTDVYVFDASRKPGLNTAITFQRRIGGELVGVISVAIELERISRYLASLNSLRSGAAFIMNRSGRLIAFQDPLEVTRPSVDPEQPELKPLADSHHPLLMVAQEAIGAAHLTPGQIDTPRQLVGSLNGGRYFVTLAPAMQQDWLIGTVIPEADFMSRIEENYSRLALAVMAAILLVGAIAILASRFLFVQPLQRLMGETRKIAHFDLANVNRVSSPIVEIDALSASVEQMSRGLGSFRRYLPADLVQTLMDQGVLAELGGERRTLSILFMDLEGFTSTSERMGHRVVPLLGEYFAEMSAAIQGSRGTIDKFIGDAVMAFWGAPRYNEEHPADACRAALDCQRRMAELRGRWSERGLPEMKVRIGVNTGRVVVGNIGSTERLNYTVIGDPVNLAARLEAMNKEFGTGILISQHTYELAKYDIVARRLDAVAVRGREELVGVYELLAMRDEQGLAPGFEWVAMFERGLSHYAGRRWHEAVQQFRAVLELRPEDPPSRIFLARTEERIAAEPKHPVLATQRPAGAGEPA